MGMYKPSRTISLVFLCSIVSQMALSSCDVRNSENCSNDQNIINGPISSSSGAFSHLGSIDLDEMNQEELLYNLEVSRDHRQLNEVEQDYLDVLRVHFGSVPYGDRHHILQQLAANEETRVILDDAQSICHELAGWEYLMALSKRKL